MQKRRVGVQEQAESDSSLGPSMLALERSNLSGVH